MSQVLESNNNRLLVQKYQVTLITGGALFFLFPGGTWIGRIFITCTLGIAAMFHGSLASVRLTNRELYYRRGVRWHRILFGDVVSAGQVAGIGYIRLRNGIPPWGPLFFVLDNHLSSNHSRILDALRRSSGDRDAPPPTSPTDRRMRSYYSVAGLCSGVLAGVFVRLFVKTSVTSGLSPTPETNNSFAMLADGFHAMLNRSDVVVVMLVVFIMITVWNKKSWSSLITAFLAGLLIVQITVRVMSWLT
jgi:hypothetical protein